MFTYKLTDNAIENGQTRVTFEFTDGTTKVSRTWNNVIDEDDIDRRITAEIAALDKAVALNARLVKNAYTMTEKPQESEQVITPREIAERKVDDAYDAFLKQKITEGEYAIIVAEFKALSNPK